MKKLSFSCGDKIYIQIKNCLKRGIVCESINTINIKMKVRVVTENGKIAEIMAGKITKR